ncbi:MAG: NAD(P)H-dependent oxidoreductase subunit E [Planctomycetota bacterium]|jgi:NADH-quinone oxidoreductase subunit E|nr:NAD(P)H-dependent oxidoreductase subunit E [Planctomycetota bacterium]
MGNTISVRRAIAKAATEPDVIAAVRKWKNKRGSLIMVLHEIQNARGYVPRDVSLYLAEELEVPLARIYEALTFYHYFKLEAPGKAVISVCTGTACYLKGSPALLDEFVKETGAEVGGSTPDKLFHLQCVRCVGCCGLAPVVNVNGRTYGKLTPADIKKIVHEWRAHFAGEIAEEQAHPIADES